MSVPLDPAKVSCRYGYTQRSILTVGYRRKLLSRKQCIQQLILLSGFRNKLYYTKLAKAPPDASQTPPSCSAYSFVGHHAVRRKIVRSLPVYCLVSRHFSGRFVGYSTKYKPLVVSLGFILWIFPSSSRWRLSKLKIVRVQLISFRCHTILSYGGHLFTVLRSQR